MQIVSFGNSKEDWRLTALLSFCKSHASCLSCSLRKTSCAWNTRLKTEWTEKQKKEALEIIVREDR